MQDKTPKDYPDEYMVSLRQAIEEIEATEPPAPTTGTIEVPAPLGKLRGRPRIHPVSTEPKKAVGRPRTRTVDEQKEYRREYLRKYKQEHKHK